MTTPAVKKKADLKVVILGDAAVGKSSLIQRYIQGTFKDNNAHALDRLQTIGASFFLKQWGPYNVAFWDTAGEERFSGLSSFYCRGASAAILAYDISASESFESLWARFLPLLASANDECLKVVVGTKRDLVTAATRQVTMEEGENFSKEINGQLSQPTQKRVPFFETSSCTGENVNATYDFILNTCLPLTEQQRVSTNPTTVTLSDSKPKQKSGCCG